MKWTIKNKFFISYLLLFTVAGIVFHVMISKAMEQDTVKEIEQDLQQLQYTTMEYLRQMQSGKSDNILETSAGEVAYKLSEIHHHSVALFNARGEFIYESIPIDSTLLMSQSKYNENLPIDSVSQLNLAYDNQSSYYLSKVNDGTIVYFTFPVYIEGEFLGILRFTGDYTSVFERNDQLVNSFSALTVLLLVGVFIISLILTNQITKPLHQLKEVTNQISSGNYNVVIPKKSQDEIGDLSDSFSVMLDRVKNYTEKMEVDYQQIVSLEQERTSLFQNVTHELRTPLTTISGYAQIIGDKDFSDRVFLMKAAERIYGESNRLNALVTQLLTMSKETNTLEKTMVNVSEVIETICEDFQMKMKDKNITFSLSLQPLHVFMNENELKQIFINLIDNSVKYSKENATISILVDQTIQIRNECKPLHTRTKEQLFLPFNRVDKVNSHGLGLYITKQLVEKNGGQIRANVSNESFEVEVAFLT